jgi:hypothetical protein
VTIETLTAAARVPRTAVKPTPVADLEDAFGTRLPADYPRYVAAVPPGYFRGYLHVLQPSWTPSAGDIQWIRGTHECCHLDLMEEFDYAERGRPLSG